jgi:hypothetical protein
MRRFEDLKMWGFEEGVTEKAGGTGRCRIINYSFKKFVEFNKKSLNRVTKFWITTYHNQNNKISETYAFIVRLKITHDL